MNLTLSKYILITVLLFCITCVAFGQDGPVRVNRPPRFNRPNVYIAPGTYTRGIVQPGRQIPPAVKKLQTIKVNFVNTQLNLNADQASKFVPLYHEFLQEQFILARLKRFNISNPQVSAADKIQRNLDYDRQLTNIRARYTGEFLKILPPEKVSLIAKSENEFNDEITRQPYERQPQQSPPTRYKDLIIKLKAYRVIGEPLVFLRHVNSSPAFFS
jgi:hypothetical protein